MQKISPWNRSELHSEEAEFQTSKQAGNPFFVYWNESLFDSERKQRNILLCLQRHKLGWGHLEPIGRLVGWVTLSWMPWHRFRKKISNIVKQTDGNAPGSSAISPVATVRSLIYSFPVKWQMCLLGKRSVSMATGPTLPLERKLETILDTTYWFRNVSWTSETCPDCVWPDW